MSFLSRSQLVSLCTGVQNRKVQLQRERERENCSVGDEVVTIKSRLASWLAGEIYFTAKTDSNEFYFIVA